MDVTPARIAIGGVVLAVLRAHRGRPVGIPVLLGALHGATEADIRDGLVMLVEAGSVERIGRDRWRELPEPRP